jgi:hypothetical protein
MTRISAVEAVPSVSLSDIHAKASDPLLYSSMGAADKERASLSFKPELPAPDLVRQTLRLEALMNKLKGQSDMALARRFAECSELEKEILVKVQESAAKTQDSSMWGLLQEVGALFIAALNTTIGFTFFSSGSTLVGGALVASGILSIANFIFAHTGVWDAIAEQMAHDDEALQKKIKTLFPAALGLVSASLAISGGMAAAFSSSLEMRHLLSIGQTAAAFVQGALTIGSGVHEMRAKTIAVSLEHLNIKGEQIHYAIKDALKDLEEFYNFIGESIKEADLFVKTSLRQIQAIQQPV